MKKKVLCILCAAAFALVFAVGCGSSSTADESTSAVAEVSGEEESQDLSEAEETAAEDTGTESDSAEDSDPDAAAETVLEDGVYTADFNTDSTMFHVNEACDGKGTLTVENGQMTIHVSLVSQNIVNLYVGLAEDAQADGAVLLEPTVDEVTYSDGITEEVYGFDIPVEALDEKFDVAILGAKGTWYDHKVSVSNPELLEE